MTNEIFILLIAFQIKHLIADYYLQYPYMYENKGKPTGWVMPLIHHSGVHMIFTALIVCIYMLSNIEKYNEFSVLYTFLVTILFDFVTHFITDRWKATRKGGPNTSSFWTNLGIDQMIHHLVGILIIWWIV